METPVHRQDQPSVFVIGIAGGSGSGKTTLAESIAKHFGDRISILRHDDYYKVFPGLTLEERARLNYDHPDTFDNALLLRHLDSLRNGIAVDSPQYDYKIHDRSGKVRRVEPNRVILLEGILIFENEEICKRLNMKVFIDTDPDVRIVRRILRDVKERGRSLDSVIDRYLTTVKPMHEAFVEPSKKKADIIIPEGGKNRVAYGILIDRIEKVLQED